MSTKIHPSHGAYRYIKLQPFECNSVAPDDCPEDNRYCDNEPDDEGFM